MTAVTDAVATMLHAVDDLDWATVRTSFTDQIATDYTSLWGGEPQTLAVDQLVAWWQQLAPGYDATQHHIGPVIATEVDHGIATCTTNVRAYHRVGQETWLVAGRYEMRLVHSGEAGWQIAAITLRCFYEDGDRRLVDLASGRVSAGTGGRVDVAGAISSKRPPSF